MIIQHNIMALNAHRQMGVNNGLVSKSLEKLSSGFRINKAGDDAAGLAISEKMRSQINGLQTAERNAQDGISLIQTAEGALQETHSILQRMNELATQSANGTYDDAVDRQNLQKEVEALKGEMDRISKSTNFNGISLLDGSISKNTEATAKGFTLTSTKETTTTQKSVAFKDATGASTVGDKISYTVAWKDGNGKEFSKTMEFEVIEKGSNGAKDLKLQTADGTEYILTNTTTPGKITKDHMTELVMAELKKNQDFSSQFEVTADATGVLTFTAKQSGSAGAQITALSLTGSNGTPANKPSGGDTLDAANSIIGEDAYSRFSVTDLKVAKTGDAIDDLKAKVFEIDGKKFIIQSLANNAQNALSAEELAALGSDVTLISIDADAIAKDQAKHMEVIEAAIASKTGLDVFGSIVEDTKTGLAKGDIVFLDKDKKLSNTAVDNSLSLQVGDTAGEHQQVKVSVGNMSTSGLGVQGLNVATQDSAAAAVDLIKQAINTVSSTRAELGAAQNRLEHTIANLGVTRENITAAESRIRDVDMAKEMMQFTKMNVLTQAAQAMLAQANQQPQQILQLLR